jgi:hypothetical protein
VDIFGMAVSDIGGSPPLRESHRAERAGQARSARVDAGRRKPASKQCSIRNFGEYAFLEDSRYTSQQKNALATIVMRRQRFTPRWPPRTARRRRA